ncbi:Stm1-domain-containing protein [Aspergillus pseudotamarii]|uniref:Stm1-domain-containing protein n=1 Tax=Aspergillus pseudotamarii TaxID=132259 RepID=A0A5N6SPC4_ASPPS|nr:Stm1-domain-containing protein [Aspergillus pseudotamarii]KAE8135757.1 Stm1-domain-containing protein [Aspergillus pseudotamarii]
MTDVRSKNLYELLGNDPELDPSKPPAPPTKAIDKPAPRVGKRDAPKEAPSQPRAGQSSRRGNFSGNEAAFRDRNAGRNQNREKPTDEREGGARRGGRPRNDRQSRTGQTDTGKKVNQGWGGQSGEKELDDERAGEKIAQADENEPQTPAEEAEPADKAKSYNDYLVEKAAAGDFSAKAVRAANEGSKADSKWANAKEFKREEDDDYIKGSSDKAKREKARKEKNILEVDMRFVEAPRGSSGPRGRGGRGGRGARGGRGNGPRGERTERSAPVTVDEKNFPSLGGK